MNRIAAFLLFLVPGVVLAESPADYRASATLTVAGGEGLHRVEVPFEVHRAARPDLADIRVFNARGDALPFAFASSPSAPPPQAESVPVPLFAIQAPAPGATHSDVSLDVRASKDGTLVSLRTKQPTVSVLPGPRSKPLWSRPSRIALRSSADSGACSIE